MKFLLIGANKKVYAIKRIVDELEGQSINFDFLKLSEVVFRGDQLSDINGFKVVPNDYNAVYFRAPSYLLKDKSDNSQLVFKFINELKTINHKFKEENVPALNDGIFTNFLFYDKFSQAIFFEKNKISHLKTIHLIDNSFCNLKKFLEIGELRYPIVSKESDGGLGDEVFKIGNNKELKEFIFKKRNRNLIFQNFVKNNGDYRVLICGGKSLGIMKRKAKEGDWKNNFSQGGDIEKYNDPKMEKFCIEVCRKMSFDYAGVDIFKEGDGKYKVIEVNMFPGFEGFEKSLEINVAEKIVETILRKVVSKSKIVLGSKIEDKKNIGELFKLHNKSFDKARWCKKYFKSYFKAGNEEQIALVIFFKLRPIGAILGKRGKRIFNLESVFLEKGYRGFGFSEKLMRAFIREIKKDNANNRITLHFRESKKEKLYNFYKKFGFKGLKVDGFYRNGEKRYYMEKVLK